MVRQQMGRFVPNGLQCGILVEMLVFLFLEVDDAIQSFKHKPWSTCNEDYQDEQVLDSL